MSTLVAISEGDALAPFLVSFYIDGAFAGQREVSSLASGQSGT